MMSSTDHRAQAWRHLMSRWCTNRPRVASPFRFRVSDDPDGDRHAEPCHPVEHVAPDLRLGPLSGQSPGVEAPADDGFVSIHPGFGQAAAVVARAALPTHAPVFCNRREMPVAL